MANRSSPKRRSSTSRRVKAKQPPLLFDKTQRLLTQVERRLDGPLLTYWNNSRGGVCDNDVIGFYEILERLGQVKRLNLFIKSDGGDGEASLRVVNLIRGYCKQLTVHVPLSCASAATMIALGANDIHMGPMAHLTAVDTSLTHDLSPLDRDNDRVSVSLDELKRVVSLWRSAGGNEGSVNPYAALYEHVHPLVIGAVDRASSLSEMLCQRILAYHVKDARKINAIARALNSKYPSHSFPILPNEASELGLTIKAMDKTLNGLLLDLNELYSEMGQRAVTDFDEHNSHSNEILNIIEAKNALVFFQQDKDWFYRAEERRWDTMNDNSAWHRITKSGRRTVRSQLHIS